MTFFVVRLRTNTLDSSSDTPADQLDAYVEVNRAMSLDSASVEKDFWVCWTLREIFSDPDIGGHITFKGGTSLSRAWKLIERFTANTAGGTGRRIAAKLSICSAANVSQKLRRFDRVKIQSKLSAEMQAFLNTARGSKK